MIEIPTNLPKLKGGIGAPGSGEVCAEHVRGRDGNGRFNWASDTDRFWAKVVRSDDGRCWDWLGSTNDDGYGNIIAFGEVRAHRASWVLHRGAIPKGLCVLHQCDNPRCTDPDHLFLGTIADNNADRNRKGRDVKAFPLRQKVTPSVIATAREMRMKGFTQQAIADFVGVSRGRIAHYIGDVLPRGTRGVNNELA